MSTPAIGAALAYTQQLLGGPVFEQDSSVTTSANIQQLVPGNGDRVALVIINTGSNDAMIWLDSTISSTVGIRIAASGGSVTMEVTEDFTLPSRQWFCLQINGATPLAVIELVRSVLNSQQGRK